MNAAKMSPVALLLALAGAGSVDAQQWRCDCTSIVDTCTANVESRGSYLDVKTNAKQCSRVDYFVDGLPFVSVVVDGEDRQDWLARTTNPKIIVQSCQVCRDNGDAPAAKPVATPHAASGDDKPKTFEPLIASVAEYPTDARRRRVEGYVDVEYTVNALGNVEGAHATASQPKGVFDAAAIAAVSRWRYPAEPERAPQTLTKRIDFKLERAQAQAAAAAEAPGPRNQ